MRVLFAALVLACSFACSPKTVQVSTLQLRTAAAPTVWASLTAQERQLVTRGEIQVGMQEGAIYLARGMPIFWWDTRIADTTCRALLYANSDTVAEAIYTCGGRIVRRTRVEPTLPCWRVSTVGRRIVSDLQYFEALSLERQWEIVAGLLRRGQAERDVSIAFGKPYNRGTESREDGKDVGTSVYLAEGGDTYGLYVNFIDSEVVGWKIPADRRLTPEAQQRRLEATEKRLMAQLKEMEANAAKRHRESAQLLNAIQAGQESMRQDVFETASALAAAAIKQRTNSRRSSSTREDSTNSTQPEVSPDRSNCRMPEPSTGKFCKSNDDCHNGTICVQERDAKMVEIGDDVWTLEAHCKGHEVLELQCD